jgi:uncharacterized protein YndB with AHSA1/START domain
MKRTVTHATFVVERVYDAPPAMVFAAFAEQEAKAAWFHGPEEWEGDEHTLDFRVGGREKIQGGPKGGQVHTYDGLYYDIVEDERIVLAYEMHLDGKRISVSLATIEFKASGKGTKLTFTEQGAFLDGFDNAADREHGTSEILDQLGRALKRQSAAA